MGRKKPGGDGGRGGRSMQVADGKREGRKEVGFIISTQSEGATQLEGRRDGNVPSQESNGREWLRRREAILALQNGGSPLSDTPQH